MPDWLVHLVIQIGGVGAVWMIVKWLLKPISTALNSYVAAYSEQKASIDARFANLESLSEEQAHIARAVESIKDQFSAQAKSRDNRWDFQKEVYYNLIKLTADLAGIFVKKAGLERLRLAADLTDKIYAEGLKNKREINLAELERAVAEFITYANIAPLATADDVNPLVQEVKHIIGTPVDYNSPAFEGQITQKIDALTSLLQKLQIAGRKALWKSDESKGRTEVAKQS
jgi:hypothetical protein